MRMRPTALAALLGLFSAVVLHGQSGIEIKLLHGSKPESETREQLVRLLKTYDLAKWTFTKSVIIDQESIPHSDPVLTLSTRHLRDDELLLSTYIHEQLHWFFVQRGGD